MEFIARTFWNFRSANLCTACLNSFAQESARVWISPASLGWKFTWKLAANLLDWYRLNNELACRDIKESKTEFHVPKVFTLISQPSVNKVLQMNITDRVYYRSEIFHWSTVTRSLLTTRYSFPYIRSNNLPLESCIFITTKKKEKKKKWRKKKIFTSWKITQTFFN